MSQTVPTPTGALDTADPAPRRSRWPLYGVTAGLLGIVATIITDIRTATPDAVAITDPGLVESLSRPTAHVGVIAGYLTVALLLVLAAAWRQRVEPRVPQSTAARVVPGGLVAAAGALTLGYGWKGALAIYLPGGMDEGAYDMTGLYIYYLLNDFGGYLGWLGVVVAAGAMAWMGLAERTISRWIGLFSLLPVLVVVGYVGLTGLPGAPALAAPLWMVIAFTGLACGRSTISR